MRIGGMGKTKKRVYRDRLSQNRFANQQDRRQEKLVIITGRMVKKPSFSREWLCLKKSGDGSIISSHLLSCCFLIDAKKCRPFRFGARLLLLGKSNKATINEMVRFDLTENEERGR
jgi:hypothetical protein